MNELNEKIKEIENFIKGKKDLINEEKRKIEEIKKNLNINTNINIKELKKLINKMKEKEINELKLSFSLFLKSSNEKIISLIFISNDENIHYSLACKNTDNFSEIESLLYNKYPDYKNLNKSFILNGNKIDITKNLIYNNIKNSDIITLKINN